MRMLLKVQLPVDRANEAIQDGSLPRIIETVMSQLQPEAAYFTVEEGMRTALIFFDMADPSQMPVVAEPLFQGVDALLDLTPVMTGEELRAGLEAASG